MIANYQYYNTISENLSIDVEKKEIYGEINTPFHFIEQMYNLLPIELFKNTENIWLDAGSGCGNFSIILYFKLMKNLSEKIPDSNKRSKHIIENMLYMSEINEENINKLKYLFGNNANILEGNFLEIKNNAFKKSPNIIIGNPPFNVHGSTKVPTNNLKCKKNDGKNAWIPFIKKKY